MRKSFVFLVVGLLALALASSCETLNIGGGGPVRGPQITDVTVTAVGGGAIVGAEDINVNVTFASGTGPFTILYTFSAGVTPGTIGPRATATNTSDSATASIDSFQTPDTKDLSVTVAVTDATGVTSTFTRNFTAGKTLNQDPVINNVAYDATTGDLTVDVSDPDAGDTTLTVSVTTPAGFNASATSDDTTNPGTATFNFSATDLFGGGNGTVDITVTDPAGATDTASQAITRAGITLEADTLYAIPLSGSTSTGAPVRIVVATGVPANPFQYMTGCRVTADSASGFEYNAASFDVGAWDGTPDAGAANPVDGIWADMNPGGGFLLAPDNFIVESDAGGGLTGIDFNVTPIGGSDLTTADGELFSFEALFSAAGTWQLGFQDVNVVSRTYYQDGNQAPDFFWGDITNDHAGVPNSVTVN